MKNHTERYLPPSTITAYLASCALLIGLWLCLADAALAATTPTGSLPLQGINYIPVDDENQVYVIDTHAHKVIKKIPVGVHPIVLKALPDRSKVYVDNFGPLPAQVSVIDTSTNTVIKNISTFGTPYASMELSPDGHYLYVPTVFSTVQVIDTRIDQIVKTIPTGLLPMAVQVSPDGGKLYVFSGVSTVESYDTRSGARLAPVLFVDGLVPAWTAITPDGNKLYALNFVTSNITVIDTKAWRVTKSINQRLDSLPLSGTINPDGSRLYVCNIGTYNITIIDTKTDAIIHTIPTRDAPAFVGFSPDGRHAYLSDLGPLTALPPLARPLLYDLFYLLPPGLPGYLSSYDTSTLQQEGTPVVTGTGPVAGVYF